MRRYLLVTCLAVGCGDPPTPKDDPHPDPVTDTDESFGPTVGRVSRLTRRELGHAAEDLLGVDAHVEDFLPRETATGGFDAVDVGLNIGEPLLLGLQDWAEDVALRATAPTDLHVALVPNGPHVTGTNAHPTATGWQFVSRGSLEFSVWLREAGDYVFALDVDLGELALTEAGELDMEWLQRHLELAIPDMSEVPASIRVTTSHTIHADATLRLAAGWNAFTVTFGDLDETTTGVIEVDGVGLSGPSTPTPLPSRDALFRCEPDATASADAWSACAASILDPLARRAWRSAVDPAWDDDWSAIVAQSRALGEPFSEVIRHGIERILESPRFLLTPLAGDGAAPPLTDHEIAARMARLLWSSVPDAALLDRADRGELQSADARAEELTRMLADPRSQRFADEFVGQWLGYLSLPQVSLDVARFPELDDTARAAMAHELTELGRSVVTGGHDLSYLLTATQGAVWPPLDLFYGLPAAAERADLGSVGRQGLLGSSGFLALTSQPTRTSPTRRGSWILSQLLCEALTPPAAATPLTGEAAVPDALKAHAEDPACSGCHLRMDPLGTALEGYDALGRARDTYLDGTPIVTAGKLPDGTPVSGIAQLSNLVVDDPRFDACAANQLLTYAFGRVFDKSSAADLASIDAATAALETGDRHLTDLLRQVVTSPAFVSRGAAP